MHHALILAGGVGTRFWPRSRKDRPKQVLHITGHRSLIQETISRVGKVIPSERIFVITSEMQYAALKSQIGGEVQVILEPFGRDTAASIGLGAEKIRAVDPDAIIATFPADHHIHPEDRFATALEAAIGHVETDGGMLLFGIPPDRPATSYGYIHRGEEIRDGLFEVRSFREKPDRETAQTYLEAREYFWNSGMFVWRAEGILRAIRDHHPDLGKPLDRIRDALGTPGEDRVIREAYEPLLPISIDYAVLEKVDGLQVQEATFNWDDVGSWLALERLHRKDEDGNVSVGRLVGLDCRGLVAMGGDRLVAALGVEDLIIVESRDAILVAHKSRAEDVKALVKRIEEEGLEAYL